MHNWFWIGKCRLQAQSRAFAEIASQANLFDTRAEQALNTLTEQVAHTLGCVGSVYGSLMMIMPAGL